MNNKGTESSRKGLLISLLIAITLVFLCSTIYSTGAVQVYILTPTPMPTMTLVTPVADQVSASKAIKDAKVLQELAVITIERTTWDAVNIQLAWTKLSDGKKNLKMAEDAMFTADWETAQKMANMANNHFVGAIMNALPPTTNP